MDAVRGVRLVICALILTFLALPIYFALVPLDGDYSDTQTVRYDLVVEVTVEAPSDNPWPTLPKLYTPMMERYVMPEDQSVRQVADALKAHAQEKGYDDRGTVNLVKRWVALNIDYVPDSEAHGWSDHWQTPYQTLRLGTGDCEDFAILFVSICEALGYGTVLVSEPDHISAGVLLEPGHGDSTVSYGGREYVSAETVDSSPVGGGDPEVLVVYPTHAGPAFMIVMAIDILVLGFTLSVMRGCRSGPSHAGPGTTGMEAGPEPLFVPIPSKGMVSVPGSALESRAERQHECRHEGDDASCRHDDSRG